MYDKYAFEGQITKHKSNTEWYWLTDSRVDYSNFNGEQGAKDGGRWRLEGKDYAIEDGDVIHFRFNV